MQKGPTKLTGASSSRPSTKLRKRVQLSSHNLPLPHHISMLKVRRAQVRKRQSPHTTKEFPRRTDSLCEHSVKLAVKERDNGCSQHPSLDVESLVRECQVGSSLTGTQKSNGIEFMYPSTRN